ncbi:hypothetical protein B0H17DRAFT_1214189 [Mycena rosella]|uniref:Retrotransposon gag domain-containing protein n=1 Tax=Mycena rosella TaxID=1033263 RepID=A0AAD7CNJ9_MYCRO|nr:hypothetical protein B0H17DRAFT_1214189 [Mycena rosella]
MDYNKVYSTRARTRSGAAPPPPPLFDTQPTGALESGDSGVEAIANAMKPSYASAVAGLAGASRAGNNSPELPSFSDEVIGGDYGLGSVSFEHEDGGEWTPVTRKTSHSHRERSTSRGKYTPNNNNSANVSDSESTIEVATDSLSQDELAQLVRRHEAFTAQLRAKLLSNARTPVVANSQEIGAGSINTTLAPAPVPERADERVNTHTSSPKSYRATVEEVEDEGDTPLSQSCSGRKFNLRRSLKLFTEQDLLQQQEMLANYAEINHVMKDEGVSAPPKFFTSTPVQFSTVEPDSNVSDRMAVGGLDSNSKAESSLQEMISQLTQKIGELDILQRKSEAPTEDKSKHKVPRAEARDTAAPRESTPGRAAAESFFRRALWGAPSDSRKGKSPRSDAAGDPDDSSSSSSSDSSSDSSDDDHTGASRRASSPRLSSKRKRGHGRKQRMLLKPIPPSRYNGEPDSNTIERFAREAKTYVEMGRVETANQVYFIAYYLDGKALDFHNQIFLRDRSAPWTLKRFLIELFEFCFPVDFRNSQRKRLNRCFQNGQRVAEHVAEWGLIYNTIGLPDDQEKVVKLFNSFTYPIQAEIRRKDLDPEENSWDDIIKVAEKAEILVDLDARNRPNGGGTSPPPGTSCATAEASALALSFVWRIPWPRSRPWRAFVLFEARR